jgi:hypothetical protein
MHEGKSILCLRNLSTIRRHLALYTSAALGVYTVHVSCEERGRLTDLYLAAIANLNEVGQSVQDVKSDEWREATRAARDSCEVALRELHLHKAEHGC